MLMEELARYRFQENEIRWSGYEIRCDLTYAQEDASPRAGLLDDLPVPAGFASSPWCCPAPSFVLAAEAEAPGPAAECKGPHLGRRLHSLTK